MKKRMLSVLLTTVMAAGMLAGCGGGSSQQAAEPAKEEAAKEETAEAPAEQAEAPAEETASEEGKVFNIYCWNEEFKSRLTDHYPGYQEVDATHGKIGDVDVVWNITPNQDNAYQNNLDQKLLAQADAPADEKIDLFLVEADYAIKYVDTDYTLPIADLGITDADLSKQFQYTKDTVTDSNGVLKGVSWQGCPGVLIYNREAAKEIFGTDDQAAIQEKVKDWDTFIATAKEVAAAGYKMTAGPDDYYRVFDFNKEGKSVQDGKIVINPSIEKWIEVSKELYDAKAIGSASLWDEDWNKGFYPEGKVFCYFGPAWLVDFSMKAEDATSIAAQGGWAATAGPQGFAWGGTWITAAAGTDNPSLIKDIILKLTTDDEIMKDIVVKDNDFVNNKPVMEAMAQDESYSNKVLGGQNPLGMFCEGAENIAELKITAYDQTFTEQIQAAMKNYFEGNATLDEAKEAFFKAVVEKHPELSY